MSVDSIGRNLSPGWRVIPADGCSPTNGTRRYCFALGYCDCRVYLEICSPEFGASSFCGSVVRWIGNHIQCGSSVGKNTQSPGVSQNRSAWRPKPENQLT